MIPTWPQWKKWSLPTKIGYIGSVLGILAFVVSTTSYLTLKAEKYINDYIFDSMSINENVYKHRFQTATYKGIDRDVQDAIYPQIKYSFSNKFLDYINDAIKKSVLESFTENLVQFNSGYTIGIISPTLLSIEFEQYTFHYPALNGNHSIWALNINPKSAVVYDFFDVFDARKNALKDIKAIIKRKSTCGFFDRFDDASFIPRFFIKDEGVEFIFSEYEVTSGICGNVIVDVQYDRLLEFIRSDGPLGLFLSPAGTWNADYHWYKNIVRTLEDINESG